MTTSRAGALLGFPDPLLGLAGFPVLLVTGALLLGRTALPRWCWRGLQVGVLLAAALITWLQTQSLSVIGALCPWCLPVWAVTIPVVVGVTLHDAAAGHLGAGLTRVGRRLQPCAVTVVAVWYLVVVGAIALRFCRDFALVWFGVALWSSPRRGVGPRPGEPAATAPAPRRPRPRTPSVHPTPRAAGVTCTGGV